MATWTNDQWRSTKHRVRVPPPERRAVERVSIPYFHHPNWSAAHRVPAGLRGARRGAPLRAGHGRRVPDAQGRGGVHMTLTVPVDRPRRARVPAVAAAIDDALHTRRVHGRHRSRRRPRARGAMFAAVAEFFALPVEDEAARRPCRSGEPTRLLVRRRHRPGERPRRGDEGRPRRDVQRRPRPGARHRRTTAAAAEFFTPSIWPDAAGRSPGRLGRVPGRDAGARRRILGLMAEALGLGGDFFAPLDRQADGVDHRQPLPGARPRAGRPTSSAAAPTPTTARSRCWRPTACPASSCRTSTARGRRRRPVPGAFHVNTGDMLAHWSGGHWRSTWHRVVPPPGGPPYPERTSIAYFHSPNADAVIGPLPGSRGRRRSSPSWPVSTCGPRSTGTTHRGAASTRTYRRGRALAR